MENPARLENIVMDYITSNLAKFTMSSVSEEGNLYLIFRDASVSVNHNIANMLLRNIDRKGNLSDFVMTLFDPCVLRLSEISIHNSSNLSDLGLNILKNHKISSMELWGLKNISLNELISFLNDQTCNDIVNLSLRGSSFISQSYTCEEVEARTKDINKGSFTMKGASGPMVLSQTDMGHQDLINSHNYRQNNQLPAVTVGLCKLKSLKVLILSDTNIISSMLYYICRDLCHLTILDISNCLMIESIDCLELRKNSLQSLNLFNLKVLMMEETKKVLLKLQMLLHLDISKNFGQPTPLPKLEKYHSIVPDLLRNPAFVPIIKSIDISGQVVVTPNDLKAFITTHSCLSFLGLMWIMYLKEYVELPRYCIITCIGTLDHLLEGIRRYPKRKAYALVILEEIFKLSCNFHSPRSDIIQLILPIIDEHKREAPIQLAGTACLFNLTTGDLCEGLHPHILRSVVHATLTAMDNFPAHSQLQKNALLILRSDRILHDVSFDRDLCRRLICDYLVSFDDLITNWIAGAIYYILAAKDSPSQTVLSNASVFKVIDDLRIHGRIEFPI